MILLSMICGGIPGSAAAVPADPILRLTPDKSRYFLGPYLAYLEDPQKKLTIGDVSDESNRVASDAITHLRNMAAAGAIPIWGTRLYPGEPFDPARPVVKISKEYWEAASIFPLSTHENRDSLSVKTTLEPFGASTHKGAVFNGLRVYRSAIRRYFRKNEYKPKPHKPVFRRGVS